ncbi:MAG: helix-turn-helix transcriptional regulator [Actinomycetales bacterium]|nr:helix-turn-helix transcriptional regulator [Actinomycetales bacterium]
MDRHAHEPLDVPSLAAAAHMSTGHFARAFREAYGETPHAYLMSRRIQRAKELLRHTDLSVTEVCLAVGCTSLGSFSASFTRLVGQTPSAYRAGSSEAVAGVPGYFVAQRTRPRRVPRSVRNREAAGRPHA